MKPENKQHNLLTKNLGLSRSPKKVDNVLLNSKAKVHRITPEQPLAGHHNKKKYHGFNQQLEMLTKTLPVLFPTIPMYRIHEDIQYIAHLYSYKGAEYTLRYLKASAESVEAIVLGLDQRDLKHEKVSIGKYSNGWPKWLYKGLKSIYQTNDSYPSTPSNGRLKSGLLKDVTFVRYANTLCSIRRFIVISTKTKLDSITRPISVDESTKSYGALINSLGKHVREAEVATIRTPVIGSEAKDSRSNSITTYTMPKLQVSLKKTPNGVGFYSIHWDRAAVTRHNMVSKVQDFSEVYYQGEVEEYIAERLDPYESLAQEDKEIHVGKISLTHESAKLKPRIFAILDSFSQTLLGPLHEDLMAILSKIPEDCTYNHNKVAKIAKSKWLMRQDFYGFADLSDATDSIPKQAYISVLESLRPGLGYSWVNLFDRPFTIGKSVRDHWIKHEPRVQTVTYQVGQPMGALSSWPAMALVHHCIIWTAFGSRAKSSGKYLILGDDVVVFNRRAYNKYLKILRSLGISYTNNVSNVGFEFAKRIFYKGDEITGAYTSALWASRNTAELFALEWSNLRTRGYSAGMTFPIYFKSMLRISSKRYHKCCLLAKIPVGDFTTLNLIEWVNQLTGRSNCFIFHKDSGELREVESLKAFRQLAALILKQSFAETLSECKASIELNKVKFAEHFTLHSGVCKVAHDTIVRAVIEEYHKSQISKIRYLERDLKLMYLNPTDAVLLRPNLPDLPRPIDFEVKDKHRQRLLFRAEHQLSICNALRVDGP